MAWPRESSSAVSTGVIRSGWASGWRWAATTSSRMRSESDRCARMVPLRTQETEYRDLKPCTPFQQSLDDATAAEWLLILGRILVGCSSRGVGREKLEHADRRAQVGQSRQVFTLQLAPLDLFLDADEVVTV